MEIIRQLTRKETLQEPKGCPALVFAVMRSCWMFHSNARPDPFEVQQRLETLLAHVQDDSFTG
eukprot:m.381173 g.381173  ORF g.381173 m.381173 type:complete len:63 (+) comp56242_c0_seq6:2372-2560(+)